MGILTTRHWLLWYFWSCCMRENYQHYLCISCPSILVHTCKYYSSFLFLWQWFTSLYSPCNACSSSWYSSRFPQRGSPRGSLHAITSSFHLSRKPARRLQVKANSLWYTSESTSIVSSHWCCIPKPWSFITNSISQESFTILSWSCHTHEVVCHDWSRYNLKVFRFSFCTHSRRISTAWSFV